MSPLSPLADRDDDWVMRWVTGALAVVLAFALSAAAFGIAAGLQSDVTAGVRDRPHIYWLFAIAMGSMGVMVLPELVSWFVNLDLPLWHRKYLERENRETLLPAGTTMLATARALEEPVRRRLALAVVLYGCFYVVMSIPMPLMFGIGALSSESVHLEEAVPLVLALIVPIMWTVMLVIRGPTPRPGPRGREVAVGLVGVIICGAVGLAAGWFGRMLGLPPVAALGVGLVLYSAWLVGWQLRRRGS